MASVSKILDCYPNLKVTIINQKKKNFEEILFESLENQYKNLQKNKIEESSQDASQRVSKNDVSKFDVTTLNSFGILYMHTNAKKDVDFIKGLLLKFKDKYRNI